MKLAIISARFLLLLVAILLIGNGRFEISNRVEAKSSGSYSAYQGEWMDQAFIEDESWTNALTLTFDHQSSIVTAALELTNKDHDYYQFIGNPTVTWDKNGIGTFVYELVNLEDVKAKAVKGKGFIKLEPNSLIFQLDQVPQALKSIFIQKRTMIRDPYAGKAFTVQDRDAIVSKYCHCNQTELVTFQTPISDNEDNKPWIRYVIVSVRNIAIKEYKVNLHKGIATEAANALRYNLYDSSFSKKIKAIKATSTLAAAATISYQPSNLMDGDMNTCWCEGVKGDGFGQGFTVTFPKKTKVKEINLLPGYGKSIQTYSNNGSVLTMKLTFLNGESVIADLTQSGQINLEDYGLNGVETTFILFMIIEVNTGAKYKDTCVSEVIVS